jgi:LytS/YehU family sensor histidine kinase
MFSSPYTVKFLFYLVFQALAVYFNIYYLIPRYLQKRRFTAYMIWVSATAISASLIIVGGYYVGAMVAGKAPDVLYGLNGSCFFSFFSGAFPSTVAVMTLGMSIKLTKTWMQTERKQQQLEMEKIETELKFLKYQINPHFLFNSINSIFFLIHKNPDKASDSLAKFSELLRYQLYECNDTRISLSKEIDYLENFIELEKLRLNRNVAVTLQLERPGGGGWDIAPFILMTFVENAFKHVSKHTDQANWIRMRLGLEEGRLEFLVANSKSGAGSSDLVSYGGIGLKNVQRRLDLIYPGQYALHIEDLEDRFEVKLELTLTGQAVVRPILRTA